MKRQVVMVKPKSRPPISTLGTLRPTASHVRSRNGTSAVSSVLVVDDDDDDDAMVRHMIDQWVTG